jgi:hypothetical protein
VPLRRRSIPGAGSWWLLAAAVAVAGIVALVLALARPGGSSSRSTPTTQRPAVAPIQPGRTAADEARNLSAWLRRYSR